MIDDRKNHPLNENSLIFEVGGFVGEFSQEMFDTYHCNIYIFEPVRDYYNGLVNKYQNNPKIKVHNFGLGNKTEKRNIQINGAGTSVFSPKGKTESIDIMDISQFISDQSITSIDLLELNCEGGEFEIIKTLCASKHAGNIKFIQIQFHKVIQNHDEERKTCQNLLSVTHDQTYNHEWDWEGWKLK